jgi:Ni,Fe-hydrogenase III large subunit
MQMDFLPIGNGEATARERIPDLPYNDFRNRALEIVDQGGKVVHYFAYSDGQRLKLLAVLRNDRLLVAGCDAPEKLTSMAGRCEAFHLFEREIAEQYGLHPEGHPWLKMVRYHPNLTGRPDVFGNDYREDIPGRYDYYRVAGDEIHEVAVGPVHAGVIEPGHFRFNCIGERVLHLEIQLGYQHRGAERLLLTADFRRRPIITEGIAGDTAIGHCLCMVQGIEALSGQKPDTGARIIRTIALELERIANHVGDLGALSSDVAFLPPANFCGRMRGDFLNMTLWICGNRFGKGLVRPGGVRFHLTGEDRTVLSRRIAELKPQVAHTMELLFSKPSVRARFEGCGTVSTADAEKLGLVGPAGRACGIACDVRRDFPSEYYGNLHIPENADTSGDVYARARVRANETLQSIEMIQTLLGEEITTRTTADDTDAKLAADTFVVTLNEAWRGEVSHCLLTNAEGKLVRYKIKDPSFHNWNGLAMSLRDTGISDFPLNNKSYNLSYCGFDL